jgi:hypothetical protein
MSEPVKEPKHLPPAFVEAGRSAFYRIGLNLADVTMEFGAVDFPSDNGVGFRNQLYAYPYAYLREVNYYLTNEQVKDSWKDRNQDRLVTLRDEHLIRIIATSHFYSRARQMHFANLLPQNKHMRITLDWLTSMYGVSEEVPKHWFKTVTTIRDNEAYWKESQRFFYREIAYAMVSGMEDEIAASEWGGFAIGVDMQADSLNQNEEWKRLCNEQFAVLSHEVIELRKKPGGE